MNPLTFIEFENHIIQLDKVTFISGPIAGPGNPELDHCEINIFFENDDTLPLEYSTITKAKEVFDQLKKLFKVIKV